MQEKNILRYRYMMTVAASATGRNAYFVLVAWLAVAFGHGPAFIALLLASGSLAEFATSNFAGIVADRYQRRLVCRVCDCLRMLLMGLTMLGLLSLNPLFVLGVSWVVYAVIDRIHTTALQAMIPSVASPNGLLRLNSISYMNMQAGNLVAAVAGGLLLAWLPNGLSFVLPLGCFALSCWAMQSPALAFPTHQLPRTERPCIWALDLLPTALPAGPLRRSAVVYALIYSMGMLVSVLGSSLVLEDLKGTSLSFGYLEAFWAAGSIAGCAYMMVAAKHSPGLPGQLLASGVVLAFFLVVQDLNLAFLQMTALGVTYNVSRILVDTHVQRLVSTETLGRRKAQIHTLCVGFGLLTYSAVAIAGNSVRPSVFFGCFGILMVAVGATLQILPWPDPASGGFSET